jgi:XTP/dITP diphosphohydrolase
VSRRLLVATSSRPKLVELRGLLDLPQTEVVSLADLQLDDAPEETGATFEANALLKARHYTRLSGLPALADDSGLEVVALEGGPGVRTRRYAGEAATDRDNNVKLLAALDGLPPDRRAARYVCVLAFVEGPDVAPLICRGTFEGRIAEAPRGINGFGYDPIFEPLTEQPGARTVGLLSPAEKAAVSHRARAARAMGEALRQRGW